jgi:alpha-beta hydrolase superfamily lysophospholipase
METTYSVRKISLKEDFEGEVLATLISRPPGTPSQRAILYIHGFSDYFFHDHMADWANAQGYHFYALDMRKYGRSILPHQKPNMFRDVSEYFEELDAAIAMIRDDGCSRLALLGHSTGGLVASNYAHERRKQNLIDVLVLNSPYFENNASWFERKMILPVVSLLGNIIPNTYTGIKLKSGYTRSIHSSFEGEWNYDLNLKPVLSFPITFGWLRGIYRAQRRVQSGKLNISCPVLVLYSTRSVKPGKFHEGMHTADAVLNVKHIEKFAGRIGKDISKVSIEDGKHDLSLSLEEVRNSYFKAVSEFLKKNLPED